MSIKTLDGENMRPGLGQELNDMCQSFTDRHEENLAKVNNFEVSSLFFFQYQKTNINETTHNRPHLTKQHQS